LGLDTDLNGRLFETFLTATMRGKDLGQFFTPRSIVHLGTMLAELNVTRTKHDVVWDACGGTGGFLIDALAQMWRIIDANPSMSKREKEELKKRVATQNIRGVDIGSEPNMSRLARMNMYLHGDGGCGIYEADFLDKDLVVEANDSPELRVEKKELQALLSGGGTADVVVTNPPFAKEYSRSTDREKRILDQYRIAFDTQKGKRVARKTLRSSLLFIERYHDILKIGGKLITVIDDGILSGQDYAWFRNFLRDNFAVRGVVSLPGDAFQRSDARVKTSLLLLEKCEPGKGPSRQGAVFMFPCRYVGIDDPARRRTMPIDLENRKNAVDEIERVVKLYAAFKRGDTASAAYGVESERIADRLDVKFCLEHTGRKVTAWKKSGLGVATLAELITPVIAGTNDVIITKDSDERVTCIVVGYDGLARRGEEMLASDMKYSELYRVHAGNIVVSNISAHYGAIAIIPDELDGCVVTKEISIFRPKPGYTPHVIWVLLRSQEILADLLLSASGANRTRIDWDGIKQIQVVIPPSKVATNVDAELTAIEKMERDADRRRSKILSSVDEELQLSSAKAAEILDAYKPPK
jgi:type I restriction enzyme M protein